MTYEQKEDENSVGMEYTKAEEYKTNSDILAEAEDIVYGMGYDTYDSDGHSDYAVQDILVKFAESKKKRVEELENYNKKLLESDIDNHNKIALLSKKVNDLQKENNDLKTLVAEGDCLMDNCREMSNKITDLEKENELLKGRQKGFEEQILGLLSKYYDFYDRFPDMREAMNQAKNMLEEIAKLEDTVALKDEEIGCILTDFNTFKSEAKELLNKFVEVRDFEYDYAELCEQAEQFISEVE